MAGLFRRQAMERHTDRLHGDILLLPRLSHSLVITALLLWIVATLAWLTTSKYARKETVAGWLEPDSGVVRIYAQRGGTIRDVLVSEGERVSEGQSLFIVNGDRVLSSGQALESVLEAEYASQRKLLTQQLHRTEVIQSQKRQDLGQRIATAVDNIDLLGAQAATLQRRYRLVTQRHERYQRLARDGYISAAELEAVTAEQLALEGERQALARNRSNLTNQLQQLESRLALLPEETANEAGQLRARLSSLSQRIAELHGKRAYVVKAPRDGVVNNLQAREGQQAKPGISLLSLVPPDASLKAHLLVPVRAAGFLETGQHLNIRYDAFPYQKFGLHPGEVLEVSDTVVLPDELAMAPVSIREPAYRITAIPHHTSVEAYGRQFALKPGMTLSADVRLSERNLLQWLLEPLYSLRGRL